MNPDFCSISLFCQCPCYLRGYCCVYRLRWVSVSLVVFRFEQPPAVLRRRRFTAGGFLCVLVLRAVGCGAKSAEFLQKKKVFFIKPQRLGYLWWNFAPAVARCSIGAKVREKKKGKLATFFFERFCEDCGSRSEKRERQKLPLPSERVLVFFGAEAVDFARF